MANKKKPRQPVWQWCVPCRLVCVRVLEEGTSVVWLRELQDEETPFVTTYRPGVGPEGCVSVDWLTLSLQMPVFNLIRGPLPFSHHLDLADPGGPPKSVLSQWSTSGGIYALHSRCAIVWWARILDSLRAGQWYWM
jgi:hypothetical protein